MTDQVSIVVGVDGSASALHAVRWAAREAARRDVPLRLLSVCHMVPVRHPRQIAPPPDYHAAVLEQGRHWLTEASRAARDTVPGIALSTDLRDGVVTDILIRESEGAELVVLGSRGLGGFTGLLIGSVAVTLAAHAHCPVVVLHASEEDGTPPEEGPVVVGVDGSELSESAVAFAFETAAARRVPLHAVHTWVDVDMSPSWVTPPWADVQAYEEQLLEERLAVWRTKFPDVEVRTIVHRDRPARALLKEAAGAQLVVVGSRGRGAFTGLGLGSVSQSLLHHATCPVAVVRREPR